MSHRQKLGKQLVLGGRVTQVQLDAALAMQRQFGGRLGTNLIELGALRVDDVAVELGAQLGVPAAVREHFVRADRDLFRRFPRLTAERLRVVPLGMASGRTMVMSVAMIDPLDVRALDELCMTLGCEVKALVAPEARVQDVLQKVWGIKPQRRTFVRLDFSLEQLQEVYAQLKRRGQDEHEYPGQRSLSLPPVAATPAAASAEAACPPRAPRLTHLEPPALPRLSALEPHARQGAPSPAPAPPVAPALDPEAAPRLQRAALDRPEIPELLVPGFSPPAPARPPVAPPRIAPEPHLERAMSPAAAPRVMASGAAPSPVRSAPSPRESAGRAPTAGASGRMSAEQALCRAVSVVAGAEQRDQAASAVVEYLVARYGCGILLNVKDNLALGWRGRAPSIDPSTIEALLLPLTAPSVFASVAQTAAPFRGPPPPSGEVIHDRVWKLLRCDPPEDILVVPVAVGARVVQLVYAHEAAGRALPSAAGHDVVELASALGETYRRLIQAGRTRRAN